MFRLYTPQDFAPFLDPAFPLTPIGEAISASQIYDTLESLLFTSPARYVVLGIPEDIGVRAGRGIGGTETTWAAFLRAFLYVQTNTFFSEKEVLILGAFDFSTLMDKSAALNPNKITDVIQLRSMVEDMDEVIYPVIETIVRYGKIPIIIGGGHNNALPIIKGASLGLHCALNVISMDAHVRLSQERGRNNHNAFRYAIKKDLLQNLALLGCHESFLPASTLHDITTEPQIFHATYEQMFVRQNLSYQKALYHALDFIQAQPYGIELSLSAIEHILSNDLSPCGLSTLQARQFVHHSATHPHATYLHLSEGVAKFKHGASSGTIGQFLMYLVTDFIKATTQKR